MNDVVKYQWQGQDIELTKQDVRNLISTDPNVTDKEIQLFMQLCRYQKLNPFIREAYLIKYGNRKANMVTGIETFTKRMEGNINFDGYIPSNNYEATTDRKKWWSEVAMYRKDIKYPIIHRVYYEEYVGTDGSGNITKIWRTKGRTMLDKCALMGGARKAYPTALGGLYEEHELDQISIPKEVDITPKKAEVYKKTLKKAEDKITDRKMEEDFDKHNLRDVETKRKAKEKVVIEDVLDEKIGKVVEKIIETTPKKVIDKVIEANIVEEPLPTKEDINKVFPPDFIPATDKQKDLLLKVRRSQYIEQSELDKMPSLEKTNVDMANKIITWWFGDKEKKVKGERELRELKDKAKPKGKRDELINLIRDTARIKQIPKDKVKEIAGIKTFDTLMGCKIAVLNKVLEYCQKH